MSGAYYSENDPQKAAWLRELIKAGVIADGEVDERSIEQVEPEDLRGFTQCHFFAGIGGWSYAIRLANWPDSRGCWTGSPPCQDASVAGEIWGVRCGLDGNRTGLVRTWVALAGKVRPPVIFFENVPGIAPWIAEIKAGLEDVGYTVSKSNRSAGSIGAPHLRRRVWMVADANGARLSESWERGSFPLVGKPWRTTPRGIGSIANAGSGRMDYGLPGRVCLVRSFGDAIIPQVAEQFIRAYMQARGI